jgi:hypothetical protein
MIEMDLIYKELIGFKFVKVGDFRINDKPLSVRYKGDTAEVKVSLKLIDESFLKSDESAYLIYAEDELVYVGEYSYNLKDRWLKKEDYIWHHTDIEIEKALASKTVSLWLAIDPYLMLPDNSEKINVSKSIEQEILRRYSPSKDSDKPWWNKRGKVGNDPERRDLNCERVTKIIEKVISASRQGV